MVNEIELIEIRRIGDYYYQLRTETPYGIELVVLKVWNHVTGKIIEESGHMSVMGATQRLINVCSSVVRPAKHEEEAQVINYMQLG